MHYLSNKNFKEKVTEIQSKLKEGVENTGIAGGASRGYILFHEVCKEMGIKKQLFLVLPQKQFIIESVAPAGAGWIERFETLAPDKNIQQFELYSKNVLPEWLQKKRG